MQELGIIHIAQAFADCFSPMYVCFDKKLITFMELATCSAFVGKPNPSLANISPIYRQGLQTCSYSREETSSL